jgi:hypothetical protein
MGIFPQFNFKPACSMNLERSYSEIRKKKCSLLLIVTGLDGKSNECFTLKFAYHHFREKVIMTCTTVRNKQK